MSRETVKRIAGSVFGFAVATLAGIYQGQIGPLVWVALVLSLIAFCWAWGIVRRARAAWHVFFNEHELADAQSIADRPPRNMPSIAPTGQDDPKRELDLSVEIVQPPWSKRLGLMPNDSAPCVMILLDKALITNRESARVSLTFELTCMLTDGHPYVIPERGMWDDYFKTSASVHKFLRGPVSIDPGEHAVGDLGFICNPKFPHNSDVDMFSLQLIITDQLSTRSKTFSVDSLFEKWRQANVRVVPTSQLTPSRLQRPSEYVLGTPPWRKRD